MMVEDKDRRREHDDIMGEKDNRQFKINKL